MGLTLLIVVLAAYETVLLLRIIDQQEAIGTDLRYYQFVAQRWLDTGVLFTDRQLTGPYVVQTQVDNLYPPHALYLFLPFLVLPAVFWWMIPLAFVAYVTWWCRPAWWSWPFLALLVLYPKTPGQILFGNSDMWTAAVIAAAVRFGWPAVLVTFKPSLGFFALIGIRSRSWWIAAAALGAVSLPFASLWLEYPVALSNSSAQFWYSFSSLPFFLLPISAWIVSNRRAGIPVLAWTLRLVRDGGRTSDRS